MGEEKEKPKFDELKIGTVYDFDSIDTPVTVTLEFVPKEKYDKLKSDYDELLNSCADLEREKDFFMQKSHDSLYRLKEAEDKLGIIKDYETTIKTLAKLCTK